MEHTNIVKYNTIYIYIYIYLNKKYVKILYIYILLHTGFFISKPLKEHESQTKTLRKC